MNKVAGWLIVLLLVAAFRLKPEVLRVCADPNNLPF